MVRSNGYIKLHMSACRFGKVVIILSLETGGAKGRGEHTRSLMTDERYTPKARMKIKLETRIRQEIIHALRTYPWATSP